VFVSFARYHHHRAYNVWRGRGVPPASPDAVGLKHWTLELADAEELDRVRARLDALDTQVQERDSGLLVRDPSGIALALEAN
jgi:catechol 2,3-dioxygenase